MICDFCKKKLATIHLQEIVIGKQKALHICSDCAKKQGFQEMAIQGVNIAEILLKITSTIVGASHPHTDEVADNDSAPPVACPVCSWDTKKLKTTGRMGCPACYTAFSELVDGALSSMHRGTFHCGKSPRGGGHTQKSEETVFRLARLQRRLEELIAREMYEEAASVRDAIAALKAGNVAVL